jgi:hypothetical protein
LSASTTETKAAPIPFRKSQAGRRARGQVEPVVFWLRSDGDLMLAPHTLVTPFPGYSKIECTTTSEISKWSKRMAEQEEGKLRKLRIEEMIRALPRLEAIAANCRLRRANGYISDRDRAVSEATLASVERKRELLVKIMTGDCSPLSEGALEIEKKEAPTGMAEFQQKRVVIE